MKTTVLYDYHKKLNANIIEFGGYLMPVLYQDILKEHLIVRDSIGVFDISHMGVIHIEGDSLNFVNYLISNYVENIPYKVTYGLLLKSDGYPIDDLMVYYINENNIYLVVNASNKENDYKWLLENKGNYNVSITPLFECYSGLAIQGPLSYEVLSKLIDIEGLTYMKFKINNTTIVSRSGYTGSDGFEVYDLNENILDLFDKLINLGVSPIGLGARDTLRFEAGMPLYGHEISESINPLEAGLTYGINFDKHDFIGKTSLYNLNLNETRHLVGIELIDKGIPRANYKVYNLDGVEIGYITTGYMLSNQKGVAMALINKEYTKKNTEVYVKIREKMHKAFIRNKKFLENKKYVR